MGAVPALAAFGDASSYHAANLADRGGWLAAMVSLRSLAHTATVPHNLPPGWYQNNRADEDHPDTWQRIPATYLTYGGKQSQQLRALQPIGPTDQTAQQAAALQGALANSLRGLAGA